MKISGSLFTFSEVSSSVHLNQFVQGTDPLQTINKICTVAGVTDMIKIYPLNGPTNRCPSWDELVSQSVSPVSLSVVITSDTSANSGILTANAYGGTPPYNYHFYCIPFGPCYQFTIDNPVQSNAGASISTAYSTTPYSGTTYYFNCGVTDDVGHSAGSNSLVINACLVPETSILMKDNTEKELQYIEVADELYDSTVTSARKLTVNKLYSINNGLLKAAVSHIHILSDGNLICSGDLKPGMFLKDKNNNPVEIYSIEITMGSFEVINIETSTNEYIANGIRTHNKQVYAYNDKIGFEWFAPAGLNRGGLGSAIETRYRLYKADRDTLYNARINPITKFNNSGVVIYGQKTMQVADTAQAC